MPGQWFRFQKRAWVLKGVVIVRRVGPDVRELRLGDRSCSIARRWLILYTCSVNTLVDSLIEGPQSVFIHSVADGVGLAAIQLARMVGAEMYATVGSEETVKYT